MSHGLSSYFAGLLLVVCSGRVAQWQTNAQPQKTDHAENQSAPLKLIKSQNAPYPIDAFTKKIEGTVTVRIVVDSSGRVTDATPLSGPPELFQAALDSVKQWQCEPPAHAPVVTKAEVSYGWDDECPAATSDIGGVLSNGRLLDKDGKVVGAMDYDHDELPPYFAEDRKAGVARDMVLSLSLDERGKVKEVHVLKSLSSHLDEAAMETVRSWTFNLKDDGSNGARHDLQLQFSYRGYCSPRFLK
jgi:TonB family protein